MPLTPEEELDKLWDALDGLHAYDEGCVDSGISGDSLRQWAIEKLDVMGDVEARKFVSRRWRDEYLTDKALDQQYSLEDAAGFWRWYEEELRR